MSPFALIDRWRSPAPEAARVAWLGQWTYAHRGLHGAGAVENSATAFARAIDAGLGIECDIQRSADGRAMVFHDWELDRLTAESGPVAHRTATALGTIALTGGEDFIRPLEHLLEQVSGKVPLLLEIKSRREARIAELCCATARALEDYAGPHAVMSFDPRVPAWFLRHSPETLRGLVVTEDGHRDFSDRLHRHAALWHSQPDFLAYDVRDLPSRFAAAQRARGLPVLTWTVRSAALRDTAALHADAAIAEGDGLA